MNRPGICYERFPQSHRRIDLHGQTVRLGSNNVVPGIGVAVLLGEMELRRLSRLVRRDLWREQPKATHR